MIFDLRILFVALSLITTVSVVAHKTHRAVKSAFTQVMHKSSDMRGNVNIDTDHSKCETNHDYDNAMEICLANTFRSHKAAAEHAAEMNVGNAYIYTTDKKHFYVRLGMYHKMDDVLRDMEHLQRINPQTSCYIVFVK